MSGRTKTPAFELNGFTNIISKPAILTGPSGVPWYETLNGQDSVDMVYEYGQKAGEASIGMGYFLKRIRDKELYKELGYDTMAALAKDKFNMEESAVSRMVNLCEKYSENNNSPVLDSKYKEYNQSQLIEMLSIKDEEVINEITPDTTVREIREIKKKGSKEPTDEEIRKFFDRNLRKSISQEQWADLKNYMCKRFRHMFYSGADFSFQGSLRGITINKSEEITWAKFVNRVYLLEDLVPDSINNQTRHEQRPEEDENVLPGQMNITADFPQYCPDKSAVQKTEEVVTAGVNQNCDVAILNNNSVIRFPERENVIIEGNYREISTADTNSEIVAFAQSCAIGAHEMLNGVCKAEEISKDTLGRALLNRNAELLLEVSRNFAKFAQDEVAFDVDNGEVQNFQDIISLIVECCEENDWFRK